MAVVVSCTALFAYNPGQLDEAAATKIVSEAFDRADRIVVYSEADSRAPAVYSSHKIEDIKSFEAASVGNFRVPPQFTKCLCVARPIVRLYSRGKEILRIGGMGENIFIPPFETDLVLIDKSLWENWFKNRGLGQCLIH